MTKPSWEIVELGWTALRSQMISEATKRAASSLANEIDDALAGLLINGVAPAAISIANHPDRTIISVNGQPRYEFKITFNSGVAHG